MTTVFYSLALTICVVVMSPSVNTRPYPGQTGLVAAADSAATASYLGIGDAPVTSPTIPGLGSVTAEYTNRDIIQLEIGMTFAKSKGG